jgi:hypothetical protein
MPTVYKILGQVNPSATTDTALYTVPSSTQAVVSTIVIANLTTSPATYRVALRPAGETIANKHYIAYDVDVNGKDSTTLTLGLTLSATDVISVFASSTGLAFSAYGTEIS